MAFYYAIFSERLNVEVRGAWSYASAMPKLLWIGTGLAPVTQWIVVPTVTLAFLRQKAPASFSPWRRRQMRPERIMPRTKRNVGHSASNSARRANIGISPKMRGPMLCCISSAPET